MNSDPESEKIDKKGFNVFSANLIEPKMFTVNMINNIHATKFNMISD